MLPKDYAVVSGVNESFALSITTAAEGVLPHEIPNHSKLVVALAWSKALSAPSSSQTKSVEMMRAPIAYGMPYVTLEFATAASKTEITEPPQPNNTHTFYVALRAGDVHLVVAPFFGVGCE